MREVFEKTAKSRGCCKIDLNGSKCSKKMSLRTSDRCHYSALRAGFAGCALYVTAVTVVWQPPVEWKQLRFITRMFENPGDCARRKYPWGTTPACALVRNDRLFPDSSIFYPIFSNFSNTLVKYSGSGAKTMTGLPSLGWRKDRAPAWRHWLSWPSSGFLWP